MSQNKKTYKKIKYWKSPSFSRSVKSQVSKILLSRPAANRITWVFGRVSRPKNRKMTITYEESFFDMLCQIFYAFEWAKKISGHSHLAPFGPICSLAPDGSAHLFFSLIRNTRHFYITYQKWKKSDQFLASYGHL